MKAIIAKPLFTTNEAEAQFKGEHLRHQQVKDLAFAFIQTSARFIRADGSLLAVVIKDALDPALVARSYKVLRKVKGDPSNRPEIFGKGVRMNRVREDGFLSPRVQTPKELVKAWPNAEANLLGGYRYRNSKPGVPNCSLTSWTRKCPEAAAAAVTLGIAVDEVYRAFAPDEYARQAEYVLQIPLLYRLGPTNFSTMYAIKNKPTAVHRDGFNIPGGMAALTTLGDFEGAELCFPQYGVVVDYKPGDVLIADVKNELHGNLPLVDGERVTCVFFVREGMHECPDPLMVEQ
jgi:hypothetical protein